MKTLIKNIAIFVYNITPSKKIKRYIRKKVIFSNRLSTVFYEEEKKFTGYKVNKTDIHTENINYLEKKIIIDLYLDSKPNIDRLYSLLNEININFDININSKKEINIRKLKKIIYLNKIMFNGSINYNNYLYYVKIDEKTFNSYNKFIINNSVQLLHRNSLTKISFDKVDTKEKTNKFQKEYEKNINYPVKNIFLYNTNYKSYLSKSYIINLSKIYKEYIDLLEEKKLNDDIYIHKIIDLIYKESLYFKNGSYNFITKTNFSFLNKEKTIKVINNYDILSFDIFDTLICRNIYNPDDIFYKMEELTKIKDYIKYRKKAESNAREKYNKDVNIYEIYDQLKELLKCTEREKNKYLNYEINLELELCYPRKEMIEFFKEIRNKKKIILVSDMYLTGPIIEKMLFKCGYKDLYDKLYVSNECDARKDTGDLFDIVLNDYKNNRIIHIGDNKYSDGSMAINKNIDSLVISTSKSFVNTINTTNYGESIIYGEVFNKKLFNSPFIEDVNSLNINNLKDFGYSIFGPLFLKYLTWFNNNKTNEEYLFVAREGYYLIKLFEFYSKLTKTKMINNTYFLTSRRAITVSNFKTKKDMLPLLDIEYKGTLKDVLFYRFGLEYKEKNINIELPRDKEIVIDVINKNLKEILNNSNKEKNNYMKYINKNIKNWKKKKLCIVDLGYSGTVQYHLSKMLDKKISGKYFVVSQDVKPLKIKCKVESCLNEVNKKEESNYYMYFKSLLLETFLTAPHGQVRCFDDNGEPIYNENTIPNENFELLDKIYNGITDFIEYIYSVLADDIKEYEYNNNNLEELYKIFFMKTTNFTDEFYQVLKVEDMYCNNKNVSIIKK